MKLVSNWRRVLWRAWSSWGLWLLIILSGGEVFLSALVGTPPFEGMRFALLYTLISVLALVARLLPQPELHDAE